MLHKNSIFLDYWVVWCCLNFCAWAEKLTHLLLVPGTVVAMSLGQSVMGKVSRWCGLTLCCPTVGIYSPSILKVTHFPETFWVPSFYFSPCLTQHLHVWKKASCILHPPPHPPHLYKESLLNKPWQQFCVWNFDLWFRNAKASCLFWIKSADCQTQGNICKMLFGS